MKTLIILSAFLLALSSCSKELPSPDPDPNSVYTPDPDPDPVDVSSPDPDPAPTPDPGDDDPCAYNNHSSNTIHWMKATSPDPVG